MEQNDALVAAHARAKEDLKTWALSAEEGLKLDDRTLSLAGEPSWVRSNLEVFTKGSVLNDHDWMQLVQSAGDYMLADLFPSHVRRMEALYALQDVCNRLIIISSPFDSDVDSQAGIDELKRDVIIALCKMESVMPATELAVMFHVLLHVPDCIGRWNSPRNYWAFFAERYYRNIVDII